MEPYKDKLGVILTLTSDYIDTLSDLTSLTLAFKDSSYRPCLYHSWMRLLKSEDTPLMFNQLLKEEEVNEKEKIKQLYKKELNKVIQLYNDHEKKLKREPFEVLYITLYRCKMIVSSDSFYYYYYYYYYYYHCSDKEKKKEMNIECDKYTYRFEDWETDDTMTFLESIEEDELDDQNDKFSIWETKKRKQYGFWHRYEQFMEKRDKWLQIFHDTIECLNLQKDQMDNDFNLIMLSERISFLKDDGVVSLRECKLCHQQRFKRDKVDDDHEQPKTKRMEMDSLFFYLSTPAERMVFLYNELEKEGITYRDSNICERFITYGIGDLKEIKTKMLELDFLETKTDFKSMMKMYDQQPNHHQHHDDRFFIQLDNDENEFIKTLAIKKYIKDHQLVDQIPLSLFIQFQHNKHKLYHQDTFYQQLMDFKNDPTRDWITFSTHLNDHERSFIHFMAEELNLIDCSVYFGCNKRLVVKKKKIK